MALLNATLDSARDCLIVALDHPTAAEALETVGRLEDSCLWFKIGIELYYAAGNSIVHELRERGFQVFLDLKLHDIPNTVAAAVRSVSACGASLLTVHAAGGSAMLQAAAEAASAPGSPRLLAVTVLTSIDARQLAEVGVSDSPLTQVLRLGRLAHVAGITGLVCSPEEAAQLRAEVPPETMLVTPGIRAALDLAGDQKRIASASQAIRSGASKLVVGRPITRASDPARAATSLLEEIARAHDPA